MNFSIKNLTHQQAEFTLGTTGITRVFTLHDAA